MDITGSECVFIAENTHVTIAPEFDHPQLKLLSGTYGPFRIYEKIDIPLWLAVHLKKQQKCKLEWPEWMQPEKMEERIAQEKSKNNFSNLPFHYGEIGKLILDHFSTDHPEARKISSLLIDLQSIRMDRVVVGLNDIADAVSNGGYVSDVGLPGISSIDLLPTKRYMTKSMDQFVSFNSGGDEGDRLGGDDDDSDNDGARRSSGRKIRLRRFARNSTGSNNNNDDDDGDEN